MFFSCTRGAAPPLTMFAAININSGLAHSFFAGWLSPIVVVLGCILRVKRVIHCRVGIRGTSECGSFLMFCPMKKRVLQMGCKRPATGNAVMADEH